MRVPFLGGLGSVQGDLKQIRAQKKGTTGVPRNEKHVVQVENVKNNARQAGQPSHVV